MRSEQLKASFIPPGRDSGLSLERTGLFGPKLPVAAGSAGSEVVSESFSAEELLLMGKGRVFCWRDKLCIVPWGWLWGVGVTTTLLAGAEVPAGGRMGAGSSPTPNTLRIEMVSTQ